MTRALPARENAAYLGIPSCKHEESGAANHKPAP